MIVHVQNDVLALCGEGRREEEDGEGERGDRREWERRRGRKEGEKERGLGGWGGGKAGERR